MSNKKPEMTRAQQTFWIVVAIFAAVGGLKFYEYASDPDTCFTQQCRWDRTNREAERLLGYQ